MVVLRAYALLVLFVCLFTAPTRGSIIVDSRPGRASWGGGGGLMQGSRFLSSQAFLLDQITFDVWPQPCTNDGAPGPSIWLYTHNAITTLPLALNATGTMQPFNGNNTVASFGGLPIPSNTSYWVIISTKCSALATASYSNPHGYPGTQLLRHAIFYQDEWMANGDTFGLSFTVTAVDPVVTTSPSPSASVSDSTSQSSSSSPLPASPSSTPVRTSPPTATPSPSRSASASPSPSPMPLYNQTLTYNTTIPNIGVVITEQYPPGSNGTAAQEASVISLAPTGLSTATWNQTQVSINSSGATSDGLVVRTEDYSPVVSTRWEAVLYTNKTESVITVAATVLYSETSVAIEVGVGNDTHGDPILTYRLPPGAVKYTLAFEATNGTEGLFSVQNYTLWQSCFYNPETLGKFNLEYKVSETEQGTSYIFERQPLALLIDIPSQAIIDGSVIPVNVSHTMLPPLRYTPAGSTGIKVCVEWKFPEFHKSLLYDPDIAFSGLLSSTDDSDPGTDEDGDDSDEQTLAIAIPVAFGSVFIIAMCVIVVIISVLVAVKAYKRRHTIALNDNINL